MSRMKDLDIDRLNEEQEIVDSILAHDKKEKTCSVCGTTVQSNIILRWKRNSDNKVFDVCALCAESNKVNSESVDNFTK